MKLLTLIALQAIGFTNDAQRVYVAALMLSGACHASKSRKLTIGTLSISLPTLAPNPAFVGTVSVTPTDEDFVRVQAKLPLSPTLVGKGVSPNDIACLEEIATGDLGAWLGGAASGTPSTENLTGISSWEAYLRKAAIDCLAQMDANPIASGPINRVAIGTHNNRPCLDIDLYLFSPGSAMSVASIESYPAGGGGGFGV